MRIFLTIGILALAMLAVGVVGPSAATETCTPFGEASFPKGSVWFRLAPKLQAEAPATSRDTAMDIQSELLVFGIRPDGVLVQNKQARFPRVLPWKLLSRNEISTDGRRTWQPACDR